MIWELLRLAAGIWHVIEARAVTAGVWGRPGGPQRLLDLDSTIFLAFLEGIVRESESGTDVLDRLYADRRPKPAPVKQSRAERNAEIRRFARTTQGSA